MVKTIVKVKETIQPLDDFGGGYSDSGFEYFKFYGLDIGDDDVEHVFGTFESGEETLVGHIYKPAEYKATVFVLHGYFDHCGQLNAPYHFVGHSTGAAAVIDHLLYAVIDHLLYNDDLIFDRVVLAAPLVHCAAWEQSKIGYNEKVRFVESVPRIFRKNSSNSDFLRFVKNKDPLQSRTIPLKWVRALHEWNAKIAELPPREKSVKIIQGTKDTTVDWRFNIRFLQAKFKNADVSLIETANHELFNESVDIRKEVFLQISNYLEAK